MALVKWLDLQCLGRENGVSSIQTTTTRTNKHEAFDQAKMMMIFVCLVIAVNS